MVRDLSETGARLRVDGVAGLPDRFMQIIPTASVGDSRGIPIIGLR